MKYWKYIALWIVGYCGCGQLAAQHDPHFTQYIGNSHINPSMMSDFDGRVMAGALYREQWRQVMDEPFQTMGAFVAGNVRTVEDKEVVTLGGMVLSDLGTGVVRQNMANFSFSYKRLLAKQRIKRYDTHWFYGSLGGYAGFRQLAVAPGLTYSSQFTGNGYDSGLDNGEATIDYTSRWVPDLGAGGSLGYYSKQGLSMRLGASIHHLNTPILSIYGTQDEGERLDIRYTIHQDLQFKFKNEFFIDEFTQFHQQSALWEAQVGLGIGRSMDREGRRVIAGGLAFRLTDNAASGSLFPPESMALYTRMRFGDMQLGLSYDFIRSALNASTTRGAFELSLLYMQPYDRPQGCPVLF